MFRPSNLIDVITRAEDKETYWNKWVPVNSLSVRFLQLTVGKKNKTALKFRGCLILSDLITVFGELRLFQSLLLTQMYLLCNEAEMSHATKDKRFREY